MAIELSNYSDKSLEQPKKTLCDTKKDVQVMTKFNESMQRVQQDFSVKEKRSRISATKLVLTD